MKSKTSTLGMGANTFAVFIAIALSLLSPSSSIATQNSGESQQNQAPPQNTLPIVGNIVFWRTGKIATPVTGRIASLPMRVGDHVNQGEVIAQIDTVQLKANLAVAQSNLLNAQAALGVAEAQLASKTTIRDRIGKLKGSPGFREADF